MDGTMDGSELHLATVTGIDTTATLHTQFLHNASGIHGPSAVGANSEPWCDHPVPQQGVTQASHELLQEANATNEEIQVIEVDVVQARLNAARQRRQRARELEESRPGLSALLPDEAPVEPPHDPDETVPDPFTRPCSMAHPDIPPGLRCVVMLKPDYSYRMCDGCRMRFKLAQVRANGIRYDGKRKARATTRESRTGTGTRRHKVRPQLIQYNGELVLDPTFMHGYKLDPRMFGPEGQLKNIAATEKASFSKALKNATSAAQSTSTRSASREGTEDVPDQAANPPVDSREVTLAAPPDVAGPSSSSKEPPSTSTESRKPAASDGLLRVRICSVRSCHNPIPADYHWKMCEPCRVIYRKWGVEKRDRIREEKLKKMSQEERDRFMTLSKGKKAQHESNMTGGAAIVELDIPFDPTIPPRPCSVSNCKHHIPGNSGYKRCPLHRKESRVYASSYAKKRELRMEVYQRAVEEGRDPEEALKDYIAQMSRRDDTSDEEDDKNEHQDVEIPKEKRKGRVKKSGHDIDPILLGSPFTTSLEPVTKRIELPPPPSKRKVGHTCGGQKCANLLEQSYAWRLCEHCRGAESVKRPPKAKKKEKGSVQTTIVPDEVNLDDAISMAVSISSPSPAGQGASETHSPTPVAIPVANPVEDNSNQASNFNTWTSTYPEHQWRAYNPSPSHKAPANLHENTDSEPSSVTNAIRHSESTTSSVHAASALPVHQPSAVTNTQRSSVVHPPVTRVVIHSMPPLFSNAPLSVLSSSADANNERISNPSSQSNSHQESQEASDMQVESTVGATPAPSSMPTHQPLQLRFMNDTHPGSSRSAAQYSSSLVHSNTSSSPRVRHERDSASGPQPAAQVPQPPMLATPRPASMIPPPALVPGYSLPYAPHHIPHNSAPWFPPPFHPHRLLPHPVYNTQLQYPYATSPHYRAHLWPAIQGQPPQNASAMNERASTAVTSPATGNGRSPQTEVDLELSSQQTDQRHGDETAPNAHSQSANVTEDNGTDLSRNDELTQTTFDDPLDALNPSINVDMHPPTEEDEEGVNARVSKVAKKMCSVPTCSVVLEKSHPFKMCPDCRKKTKIKKRMGELKRRMKLVGSKPRKAMVSEPEGSDIDAEGDIDIDE